MKKFTCSICGQENDKLRCRNTDAHDRINQLTDKYGEIVYSAVHNTEDFIKTMKESAEDTNNELSRLVYYERMCMGYYIDFLRCDWTVEISFETYISMILKSCSDLFDDKSYCVLVSIYGLLDYFEKDKTK